MEIELVSNLKSSLTIKNLIHTDYSPGLTICQKYATQIVTN